MDKASGPKRACGGVHSHSDAHVLDGMLSTSLTILPGRARCPRQKSAIEER